MDALQQPGAGLIIVLGALGILFGRALVRGLGKKRPK